MNISKQGKKSLPKYESLNDHEYLSSVRFFNFYSNSLARSASSVVEMVVAVVRFVAAITVSPTAKT